MAQTEKCFRGWKEEDGNKGGRCCCNCKWQSRLVKHPWNTEPWAKGSVTEQIGWACTTPEFQPNATFFSLAHEHSVCECHEWRQDGKDST